MKPARQRIIEYLQEHRTATASELSRVLSLTSADVRHHLSQLSKQGSLIISGHRLTRQKGRPATLYALSKPTARNNFELLSHHLLAEFSSQRTPRDEHDQFRRIAERFASGAGWKTLNITRRIYLAVKYLNDLNYDAAWEAHFHSPRLILGHCPFFAIISQHPELCLLDAFLLEALLGKPVLHKEKLSTASRDLPYCVFFLMESSSSNP
jgi:predicted ArsR family transcriptional regulator